MTVHTSLKDKVALVTGGGSGIGRAIAIALSEQGARLIVCGRRADMIAETADQIQQTGRNALAVRADVAKAVEVQRLVQVAWHTFGRVDILVNNAGISADAGQVHELDLPSWEQMLAVNLRGPLLTCRAVLPRMRAQRSGHIINISSESGLEYYPGDAAYGLTKHALNDLGEYIQRENQDWNIRVNTICPGMVISEMTDKAIGLNHARCLEPEDIAELVVFLLTRRENIKIATPILIQTMLNPWE